MPSLTEFDVDGQSPLKAVGLQETEERLYRALVERKAASLPDLAGTVGASRRDTGRVLMSLESKGLVSRSPTKPPRYVAAPPEVALEILVLRRHEELAGARLAAAELQERFRRARDDTSAADVVEVVIGREAIIQRFLQLQRTAQREVLGFVKPPFAGSGSGEVERQLLGRGVRFRVIYDREVVVSGASLDGLYRCIAAGEEARTLECVPMKLAVADHRVALVPLRLEEPGTEGALIVHSSPLLEALRTLFDALWERAVPICVPRQSNSHAADRPTLDSRLVMLLTAGLKDEAIARQLGVSHRTVQRRIKGLMDAVGARTRFQAGLQAAEKGWLAPRETPA